MTAYKSNEISKQAVSGICQGTIDFVGAVGKATLLITKSMIMS